MIFTKISIKKDPAGHENDKIKVTLDRVLSSQNSAKGHRWFLISNIFFNPLFLWSAFSPFNKHSIKHNSDSSFILDWEHLRLCCVSDGWGEWWSTELCLPKDLTYCRVWFLDLRRHSLIYVKRHTVIVSAIRSVRFTVVSFLRRWSSVFQLYIGVFLSFFCDYSIPQFFPFCNWQFSKRSQQILGQSDEIQKIPQKPLPIPPHLCYNNIVAGLCHFSCNPRLRGIFYFGRNLWNRDCFR